MVTESEYETETDVSGGLAEQYEVLGAAVVRAGFDATTPVSGQLMPGDIVDAVDGQLNANGVMRIQTDMGWVNTIAGDGTVLLQALGNDDETEMTESEYETDSDYTEAESELDPYAPVAKPARQYYVVQHAKLRIGFETDSLDLGFLEAGIVVDALDGRVNENGVMRIRISRGWVSTKAMDGTELLFPLRGLASDVTSEVEMLGRDERLAYLEEAMRSHQETLALAARAELDDSEMDTESEWTTGGDSWMTKPQAKAPEAAPKQYKVMNAAKLRAGFEQTSEDRGQLFTGEVVDAFEGRLNDSGILRIRTAKGWVSTKAGDGTRLLRPMRKGRAKSTASGSEASGSQYDTDSDFETATATSMQDQLAEQYEVLVTAKMREGFELSSAAAGSLAVGEIVDAIDGRLNDA
eukprot:SAG22_NODE_2988_length_2046_cov_1.242938_1_plen_407_part_10